MIKPSTTTKKIAGSTNKHDWAIGPSTEDGFAVFVDDRQLTYSPSEENATAYAQEVIARLVADGDYRLSDKPPGFLPPPLIPAAQRPSELLIAHLRRKYPQKVWCVEEDTRVTFEFDGTAIENPFMSDNWHEEVDPSAMYGIDAEDAAQQRSFNVYGALATVPCIARLFSYTVVRRLGEPTLAIVLERNRAEESEDVCHTHDFCDANLLMHEAFATCRLVGDDSVEVVADHLIPVWNASWTLAAAAEFCVTTLPDFTPVQKRLLLEADGRYVDERDDLKAVFSNWLRILT